MSGRITTGLMSSNTDNWATPQHIYDRLNEEFHFTLDVCASKENHKAPKFFTKADDGLQQDWCAKAMREAAKGTTVVALIPARTDTKWWWDSVMQAQEIRFIKGRLKFGGSNQSAPFPSAIVVWRGVRLGDFPAMRGMDNKGNKIGGI